MFWIILDLKMLASMDFSELVKEKSAEELMIIFTDYHSYQPEMVAAVTEELQARNVDLADLLIHRSELELEDEERLAKGSKGNSLYLIFCFLASLLGGFAGVIGGYIYAYSKTSSKAGQKYYVYDKQTRQYGTVIFWIGISVFVLALFSWLK